MSPNVTRRYISKEVLGEANEEPWEFPIYIPGIAGCVFRLGKDHKTLWKIGVQGQGQLGNPRHGSDDAYVLTFDARIIGYHRVTHEFLQKHEDALLLIVLAKDSNGGSVVGKQIIVSLVHFIVLPQELLDLLDRIQEGGSNQEHINDEMDALYSECIAKFERGE
jgi:hypothetical protein